MLEIRGGPDLGEEPLPAQHRGELRAEHLDRDVPPVANVGREINRGHPARTEFSLDPVAILQGGNEVWMAHGGPGSLGG